MCFLHFTHFKSRDSSLENCFLSNPHLFRCICMHNLQKIKLGIPLKPEIGKQNIQAKEIYMEKLGEIKSKFKLS